MTVDRGGASRAGGGLRASGQRRIQSRPTSSTRISVFFSPIAISSITSAPGGTQQAALWQLDLAGNTIDVFPLLPADGYSDSDAAAMNSSGWIVGTSGGLVDDNWVQEATLWRPEH